jgi:hypothetical protein
MAASSLEFRHPDLGLLTFDSDLWSGQADRDGREIPFFIGGRDDQPDSVLTNALVGLLDRFSEAESSALQFLCRPDVPVTKKDFTFQSVGFLWPDTPESFAFEFSLEGDPDAIWRVEFVSGQPKYSSRDD